jgi:hypothetical protein
MTFILGLFVGTIITIGAAVIWPDSCHRCNIRPASICLSCYYRDKNGH